MGSYVPPEENNAYFMNGYFVPQVPESSRYNNLRARNPRGRMPMLHHSSSNSRREVVEQEDSQWIRENPSSTRLIGNRLYDPSFAARGEPVDPHLRILKANPNFYKTEAGNKDKTVINLNN
ncbi:hypothetical protein HAX54_002123 [Datura stramonium]|uniref:Uncharacterized protein n=1 Tax=Datura stramonium TaxID=4076 RepID=A0ABS8T5K3_DATST|nr:hypothetical protein [Datura stramonium]